LALPTALALTTKSMRYPSWLVLWLSLALGIWYGVVMIWFVPRSRGKGQVFWSVVYLVGALALWFPLARSHWAYFITASSFYGLMWGTLPFGLSVVGNILLTSMIIWIQALNLNQPVTLSIDLVLIGLVVVGWSALLALWMRSVIRESTQRKHLIEQLQATQDSLAAAERQAGILQERQRLAHEIHDTLAQGFTSIVMQLEAAEGALPDEASPVRSHIQQARDTARTSLTEARRVVQALRPAPLDDASLVVALRRVVERWMQESGIETDFTVTGEPQALYLELEVTLMRSMQEALANVRKHARAQQVNVTLSYMVDQVALDIQDDGCGFDPENPPQSPDRVGVGYGLQAMNERVARLGGDVTVESATELGTTVAIQIPMEVKP
jgi:signal transduction histidine kinase